MHKLSILKGTVVLNYCVGILRKERLGTVCGQMRKRVWVNRSDLGVDF